MITVVGSSNVDIVLYVKRFTRPGETQKAYNMKIYPGGKGANQAVTVAKLGAKCYFLSCLSNDGSILIENFEKLGIKGWKIVDEPTGKAFIELTENGENRIIIFGGANLLVNEKFITENDSFIKESNIVLLQNEIPLEGNLAAVTIAKEHGATVILDPAPAQNISLELLKMVDIITPNEEELKELVRNISPEFSDFNNTNKMLDLLKEQGINSIILKCGEKGSIFYNGSSFIEIPAFKIENVVDTTAAGDVYNGALAVALDRGKNIKTAMVYASAAAAISVTRFGAQNSIPNEAEVRNFLKSHGIFDIV